MRKLIRILVKTFIVLIIIIISLDLITSFIRYRNYYKQKTVHHPPLQSVHSEYSITFWDNSVHKMDEFNSKVKVLYWHSGCPASFRWFPRLKKIAQDNSDSLEVFFITEQSESKLAPLLDTENIHLCRGAGRLKEKRFKHTSSSHIVILDKKNSLKAYGYQLNESDSIIKTLVNNRNLSPILSERLKIIENEFQIRLKNHNNLNFIITGFDEDRNSTSSRYSTNWVNLVNLPIASIYASTFRIPEYRIIDLTNRNINSKSDSNKYCVYYKTKSPFAPLIWQIIFDNREKRRKDLLADIKKRLDKEFGLKSNIVLKTTPTLILRKVTRNEKNKFKELPRREDYMYNKSIDNDFIRWAYNLKTNIKSITNQIERVLKMPVQAEYESSDKYHIILSILNNEKFTNEEIIDDLRKQGLLLDIENRKIEYLEIKNAADSKAIICQPEHRNI